MLCTQLSCLVRGEGGGRKGVEKGGRGGDNRTGELNTRAKRLRMRKVSIFKIAVANANFTTRTPSLC